jgi:hypothetical protein
VATPLETEEQGSARIEPTARTRAAVVAYRLLGLALFAMGGAAWAVMPLAKHGPAWGVGASVLVLSGLCLSVLGPRRRPACSANNAARAGEQPHYAARRPDDPEVLIPMLGVLLAFKYQAMNEWQLEKALAIQSRQGRRRQPLGRILLDMGCVTQSQLNEALRYQREYQRKKRARLPETSPVSL